MDDEPARGSYPDPQILAFSGVERMRAGFHGKFPFPPIYHLFGSRPVQASQSSVTFAMPCHPWLQSDIGVFFAGTAALVADGALGGAVMASLGPGQVVVTSDLSFNFLRPITVGSGQLIARARPIEVGRTVGLAEGLVEDAQGRIVAHCTTRCFIMSIDAPSATGGIPDVHEPTFDTPDPYLRPVPPGSVDPTLYDDKPFLEVFDARIGSDRPPPPFTELFGIHHPVAEAGIFVSQMRSTPWHSSPAGTVYGGVLAYFADTGLTGAICTTLGAGEVIGPLDLKTQFIRPVWPDGRDLTMTARVVHRGRSFATAQGEITNADGKTVALSTSSAVIRSGMSWAGLVVADDAPPVPG
jgi:uncharacterized protein (TIGR00369 family)